MQAMLWRFGVIALMVGAAPSLVACGYDDDRRQPEVRPTTV